MKIKRDIREKREKLYKDSRRLRELSAPCGEESDRQLKKMRKDQKVLYEKWRFYDGIIKTHEKVNKETN